MSLVRMRNTMHDKLPLIMLGLALVFAVGWIGLCLSSGRGPTKGGEDTSDLIARVNGVKIDRMTFEQRVDRDMQNITSTGRALGPFEESQFRGRVLEDMISTIQRNQMLKKERIRVSRGELNGFVQQIIDSRIAALKSQLMAGRQSPAGKNSTPPQMSDQALEAELRKRGLSLSQLKEDAKKSIDMDLIRDRLAMDKLMKKLESKVDTSDAAVRASYDEATFRQITIDAKSRPAAQAEKRAREISSKLKGGEDFAKVAMQYSEDGYKDSGGDRGFAVRKAYLEKPLADAVFSMKPGEISELIKLPDSFMIVKLESKESKLPPGFNDPKQRQQFRQAYIQEQQFAIQNKFFEDMQKNSKVTVYDPEMKAYMATKDMAMLMNNPPQAIAKAKEAIKELEKAAAQSGGESGPTGRQYSQLAYLYNWMSRPDGFQLSKPERVKYKALEKKALEDALMSTEATDLRMMLADILMDEGDYAKAVENLTYVASNAPADDAAVHQEFAKRLKRAKSHDPAQVGQMLADEATWRTDYESRQKAQQTQAGSAMTTKPFKVTPEAQREAKQRQQGGG